MGLRSSVSYWRDSMHNLSLIVPNIESCRERQARATVVVEQGWRAIFEEIWQRQSNERLAEIITECRAELFPGCADDEMTEQDLKRWIERAIRRYLENLSALIEVQRDTQSGQGKAPEEGNAR
jgi:hypothetical protein